MSASHPAAAMITGHITRISMRMATTPPATGTLACVMAAMRAGSPPIRSGVMAEAVSPTRFRVNASPKGTTKRMPRRIHWMRQVRVTRSIATRAMQSSCTSHLDMARRIRCGQPLPPVIIRMYLLLDMETTASHTALRHFQFFDGFADADLDALAAVMDRASFDADRPIFGEGDPRRLFALIEQGSIAIEKGTDGRPVRLATLGAGEALGEGVLLEADEPHGTTARTLEPTTIVYWNMLDMQSLLHDRPALFAALVTRAARTISRRLQSADATLVGRGRSFGFVGGRRRTEHDL